MLNQTHHQSCKQAEINFVELVIETPQQTLLALQIATNSALEETKLHIAAKTDAGAAVVEME